MPKIPWAIRLNPETVWLSACLPMVHQTLFHTAEKDQRTNAEIILGKTKQDIPQACTWYTPTII